MLFAVTASNFGITYSDQKKVVEAFNNSSRVTSWIHPIENLWLINATDTTTASDLRDLAKNANDSGPGVFVTPFDTSYAYSIGPAATDKLSAWLKKNQP